MMSSEVMGRCVDSMYYWSGMDCMDDRGSMYHWGVVDYWGVMDHGGSVNYWGSVSRGDWRRGSGLRVWLRVVNDGVETIKKDVAFINLYYYESI